MSGVVAYFLVGFFIYALSDSENAKMSVRYAARRLIANIPRQE
jgi:hypothetical protein